MDLDARYAAYEAQYAAYEAQCDADGVDAEPKCDRPEAGFHAIRATKSVPKQLKELAELRKQGIVKTSPPLPAADLRGETPWATDAVELSPAQTLVCYQAALVHATASPLHALGTARRPLESSTASDVLPLALLDGRPASGRLPTKPARRGLAGELQAAIHHARFRSVPSPEASAR